MFTAERLEHAACTVFRSTWQCDTSLAPASVLFLPFLNSTTRQHSHYLDLYEAEFAPIGRPCDVLVASTTLFEFLSIRRGAAKARAVHRSVVDVFGSKPLAVHSMSVGAFTHAVALADPECGAAYRGRIRGQIFDSIVYGGPLRKGGLERISHGVQSVAPPPMGPVIAAIARGCLALSPSTVDVLDSYVLAFKDRPAEAPTLFVVSDDDAMCDAGALSALVAEWRERGRQVESLRFETSPHAGHLRRHPAEYRRAFSGLLSSVEWDP